MNNFFKLTSTLTLSLVFSAQALAVSDNNQFPIGPDPSLTPGSLCATPDTYRHPEKIAYCNRDVSHGDKVDVIETYDRQLGFHIESMNRQDFKIDHLIPLCFGGSNEKNNLWPQHKSVFSKTDPLEDKLCQLLQKGRIKQEDAIAELMAAKKDLSQCDTLSRKLDQELHN